jgi:hypothetical protein
MNEKKDQPERHPTKNRNQKPDGQTGIRKEVIGSLKIVIFVLFLLIVKTILKIPKR